MFVSALWTVLICLVMIAIGLILSQVALHLAPFFNFTTNVLAAGLSRIRSYLHLNDPIDPNAQDGIGIASSIFGFAVGQAVAVWISERGKGVRWQVVFGYLFLSVVTWGMFAGLLRAETMNGPRRCHKYDRSTIGFTAGLLKTTVIMSLIYTAAIAYELLPGQSADKTLPILKTAINAYDDGEKFIEVHVAFGPKELGRPLPGRTTVYFEFDDKLQMKWKHEEPGGYIGSQKIPMTRPPILMDDHDDDSPQSRVLLRELDAETTYTLVFRLIRRDETADFKGMQDLIMKEQKVRVSVMNRQ